jgi:hypothetical protein
MGPFLLLVSQVRSMQHKVRKNLKESKHAELRSSILTLSEVLDSYTSHLKYLRRHTVAALLSDSRVADYIRLRRQPVTMFLALEIDLTEKDLTITLSHCPSLQSSDISKSVRQATQSLELVLSCLT